MPCSPCGGHRRGSEVGEQAVGQARQVLIDFRVGRDAAGHEALSYLRDGGFFQQRAGGRGDREVRVAASPASSASRPPAGDFDLVHARLGLVHLPYREQALRSMVEAFRPGADAPALPNAEGIDVAGRRGVEQRRKCLAARPSCVCRLSGK